MGLLLGLTKTFSDEIMVSWTPLKHSDNPRNVYGNRVGCTYVNRILTERFLKKAHTSHLGDLNPNCTPVVLGHEMSPGQVCLAAPHGPLQVGQGQTRSADFVKH